LGYALAMPGSIHLDAVHAILQSRGLLDRPVKPGDDRFWCVAASPIPWCKESGSEIFPDRGSQARSPQDWRSYVNGLRQIPCT